MNNSNIMWELRDKGGRRAGIDRRCFSYSDHIPERRCKENRRIDQDRRSGLDRRSTEPHVIELMNEKRIGSERRFAWK